jgi:integrase/recombinase XerD
MELSTAVEEYVRRKRKMGRRYVNNAKELEMFARRHPRVSLSNITVSDTAKYLNEGKLQRQSWIGRYSRLRAFFKYWYAKREIGAVPMPPPRRGRKRFFSPYIFTRHDMKRILRAASVQQHRYGVIDPQTNRVLLMLLYATGIGSGEALALKFKDVDVENARLTLTARIGLPRTIPIGSDLQKILKGFIKPSSSPADYLFSSKTGRLLLRHRVAVVFRRILRVANVRREDGSLYQPMLRDLRHTFAVHRIGEWYRQGVNVEVMLPKLAVYMGLFTLPLIERYLALVPAHFRPEVKRLSRTSGVAR